MELFIHPKTSLFFSIKSFCIQSQLVLHMCRTGSLPNSISNICHASFTLRVKASQNCLSLSHCSSLNETSGPKD